MKLPDRVVGVRVGGGERVGGRHAFHASKRSTGGGGRFKKNP